MRPLLWRADHPLTPAEFGQLYEKFMQLVSPIGIMLSTNFANRFNAVGRPERIAVAVSGGPDSLALAMLLKETISCKNVRAFMIDHNLPGMTEELSYVRDLFEKHGIESDTVKLDWTQDSNEAGKDQLPAKGKLLKTTREQRYKALLKLCQKHGLPMVLTAHQLDDDIVTMLYRTSRLSGMDGMASMKPLTTFHLTNHHADKYFVGRPLLGVPKSRLLDTCDGLGIKYILDKSNDDLNFLRNNVQNSLRSIQDSNPTLTTESLATTMRHLKAHRHKFHARMVDVFSRSVIVNRANGEATLILNDETWLRDQALACRLLTLLIQYASAELYPAKSPSVKAIYEDLLAQFEKHKSEQLSRRKRLPIGLRHLPMLPFDKTRIINMGQRTLANATIVPLSRTDAAQRIRIQSQIAHRNLQYGPAFLIGRKFPSQQECDKFNLDVMLDPESDILWDQRFAISFSHLASDANGPRRFDIKYMSSKDVGEFERLTVCNQQLRRKLYWFTGMTPGTHFHQIPVIREQETGYMAFPTLQVESQAGLYKITASYIGNNILTNKFICDV